MINVRKMIGCCLPFCESKPQNADRELDSLPPPVPLHSLHTSRPSMEPVVEFRKLISTRILNLQQRRAFTEPEFRKELDQQMQDAKNLDAMTAVLMDGVNKGKSVVQLFSQLANNIRQNNIFRYESTAVHNVYALASHKSGDCESLCKLYAFVAWSAGYKDIELKQLKGDFSFKLDHDHMLPGRQKNDEFNFVLHTVLQAKDDSGQTVFFDPLFGQCVDISAYGRGLPQYLGSA